MTSRRRSRLAPVATVVSLVLLGGLSACQQSAEDERAEYCDQVEADSAELTRISDEGGAGGFLEAMPTLEGLSEKSPSDLKDEWQMFLNGLGVLEDAVDRAGLEPDQLDDPLPKSLARADRQRLNKAANFLQDPRVVRAAQGIEQHALDVCGTPIL